MSLTLGVFSPSSQVDAAALARAEERLRRHGIICIIHPQTFATLHQSAGDAAAKIAAFHELLAHPGLDGILCARGGNRAMTMLDRIDYDLWRTSARPVIGFSDVTALLNAGYARAGVRGFHAPCLQTFDHDRITDAQIDQMAACIKGEATAVPMEGARRILGPDRPVSGPVIGGNLSLVQALCGTSYMPAADGAILMIEDIGDQLSRYDRMFQHLRHAGVLSRLAAVIIGDMAEAEDKGAVPFGFSLADCLVQAMDGYDIPVVTGAPFGHRGPLWTAPIGARGSLSFSGDAVRLEV